MTILTHDRDYGELIYKDGYRPVIYFRLKHYEPEVPGIMLMDLLSRADFETLGFFTVIDNDGTLCQRRI